MGAWREKASGIAGHIRRPSLRPPSDGRIGLSVARRPGPRSAQSKTKGYKTPEKMGDLYAQMLQLTLPPSFIQS